MGRAWSTMAAPVLAAIVGIAPAGAQTGGVSGRVTDQQNNTPVSSARVMVLGAGGQQAGTAVTADNGNYRVANLPPGAYVVAVTAIGFRPGRVEGVMVETRGFTTVDLALAPAVIPLDEIVVTVGRTQEKALDAPAMVSVVPTVEVTERPALTVTDHIKTLPGVDISQGGLVQSNVVGRGFNNVFSGATLMLTDNRFASVPSLRVNVPAFITATNDDIERVEFVLGPAAALWGPNAANGVLAVFTKSPFTSTGTTLRLETGYRADSRDADGNSLDGGYGLYRVGFRHAGMAGAKVGYKLSGEYLNATEWKSRDPAEPANPTELDNPPDVQCSEQFGCRNFDLERWSLDARIDYRPADNSEVILAAGRTSAPSLIEYIGIGAAQARDWSYSYAQVRGRWKRLFVQGFVNASHSGNDNSQDRNGTFLLRDGSPIVDRSRVWAAQFQHGFDIGTRATVLYGADLVFTNPVTDSTINGRNEQSDNITGIGGYIHGETGLSDKLELVAALRVDHDTQLEKPVFSPRVALVFGPGEFHNLRLTYNRAFSTPTTNNLFADIVAGRIPLGGGLAYNVRALGVPATGFHFRGYCGAGGLDELCMRSPFPGTPTTAFPALAAPLWPIAAGAVALRLPSALPPSLQPYTQQIVGSLLGTPVPTPAQVGTQLRRLDPTAGVFHDVDAGQVEDVAPIKPTISNAVEIGYKGIIDGRIRVSVGGWYERKENFIGPLIVESPTVFLDLTTTGHYLAGAYGPLLVQALVAAGVPQQQAMAIAAQVTPLVAAGMAGVSGSTQAPGVPLGTVVPNSALTQAPDIFLTYRNFGTVDLFGADVALDYLFDDRWSVSATYSWVSDDFFAAEEVKGPTAVALNASRSKGSVTGRFRDDDKGLSAELRGRYVKGFPVSSGVYVSPTRPDGSLEPIDSYGLVDAQVAWHLPFARGLQATLTIENLLNENYTTFVGLPQLGRLVITKIQYTF